MSRPAGRPRVLVGCLFQESGSFAPGRATWRAFEAAGVLEGAELRRDRLPGARELAAAWDRIEAAGMTVVPSLFAWAPPGPIVEQAAWERLAEAIVRRAGPDIDGVYLQLHGSMVAEHLDDPDGELLARVRSALRPGVPIAVSFDHHATITGAIERSADIVTAYRTCPHVDLKRTGRQAEIGRAHV